MLDGFNSIEWCNLGQIMTNVSETRAVWSCETRLTFAVLCVSYVRWSKGDYVHDTPMVCRVGGMLCCVCR